MNHTKTCKACALCGSEPDAQYLICWHESAGSFGQYITQEPLPHCPDFSKFKQHPLRNPDGSLKKGRPMSDEDKVRMLRMALIGIVGTGSPDQLKTIKQALLAMARPKDGYGTVINAIDALIETAPDETN